MARMKEHGMLATTEHLKALAQGVDKEMDAM